MNRIRELREEKGISQVRLSIELEVSQETISSYENGKYYPSVKSLIRLQQILGVSIDYILGISDAKYIPVNSEHLKNDELSFLNKYRQLDYYGREGTKGYMDGYLEAAKKNKK